MHNIKHKYSIATDFIEPLLPNIIWKHNYVQKERERINRIVALSIYEDDLALDSNHTSLSLRKLTKLRSQGSKYRTPVKKSEQQECQERPIKKRS